MPEQLLYNIILKSDNETFNRLYQAYLDAKKELEIYLYEEGIAVEITQKDAASGN